MKEPRPQSVKQLARAHDFVGSQAEVITTLFGMEAKPIAQRHPAPLKS